MRLITVPDYVLDNKDLMNDIKEALEHVTNNPDAFMIVPNDYHTCFQPAYEKFLKEMGLDDKFKLWFRLQKEKIKPSPSSSS